MNVEKNKIIFTNHKGSILEFDFGDNEELKEKVIKHHKIVDEYMHYVGKFFVLWIARFLVVSAFFVISWFMLGYVYKLSFWFYFIIFWGSVIFLMIFRYI